MRARLLNVGCGERFHAAWTNLDMRPVSPEVTRHDVRAALPFENDAFDGVYHSHVLEHLPRAEGERFLRECWRVLRPGGTIRVAVPDLEMLARLYLKHLEGAISGDHEAARRYEWSIIELIDQMVREQSGGEMLRYWHQNPMPAEGFVIERMGHEVTRVLDRLRAPETQNQPTGAKNMSPDPQFWLGGELHKWMYDRYSLARSLAAVGFIEPSVCAASESTIADFASYDLDTDQLGRVRKPDSLFMEACKPA
jgi:predicted SAM-dependent methyltransferase